MRVTNESTIRQTLTAIQQRAKKVNALHEQLATNRRINQPSDDPAGAGIVMRLQSHRKQIEQNQESTRTAELFMEHALGSLDKIIDMTQTVENIGVQARNGNLGDSEFQALADNVNQSLEEIVQVANDRWGGRYLFAGADTDTAPIEVTRDADGDITAVAYAGADTDLALPLSPERQTHPSINGSDAFVDNGLLDGLITLRDNLRNASSMDGQSRDDTLASDADAIADAREDLSRATAILGSRRSHLQESQALMEASTVRLDDMISQYRDADLAHVAMDLQQQNALYQAMLQTRSHLFNTTLLNYL